GPVERASVPSLRSPGPGSTASTRDSSECPDGGRSRRRQRKSPMAFHDYLARDPSSEEEFWIIIEETFVQVKGVLTDYRVEKREEALSGTLRGGNFRDTAVSIVRYRAVHGEVDNREYLLELGRASFPEVARQIKARKLTPKFAKDWGVVMMC